LGDAEGEGDEERHGRDHLAVKTTGQTALVKISGQKAHN
jgi:hypothetical protein